MNTSHIPKAFGTLAAILLAVAAQAQTGGTFIFTSSSTVTPSSPSTTIEIWAAWDDPVAWYVFAGANYDIVAGDGLFSDPLNILSGPGSSAGMPNGRFVTGGANGQLFGFPCFCFPMKDNPMLLASYTWTATDFTPRTVGLVTVNTNNYILGEYVSGATHQLFPNEFTPGAGVITVVPGPAAWFIFGAPLLMGVRRHRRERPNDHTD